MVSLPLLPTSVELLPILEMLSAPSPPSIETYAALLLIESLPFSPCSVAFSPVFIMVSLALAPLKNLLRAELWILTGVSTILTVDKFAAPCRVIVLSPTVTIMSFPSVFVSAGTPPDIKSVEFALNPVITSLSSPALYLIKALLPFAPISMTS